MKTTAAVLRELQDYYDALDPRPRLKELAAMAGMLVATVSRHLNGTTKKGIPSRVRALAIALGRQDLADDVIIETPTQNEDAWWITEIQREARESNLEEMERERALRIESEKRLTDELKRTIESRDRSMTILMERITALEADKLSLAEDKSRAQTALSDVQRSKRKYEVLAFALLVLLLLYVILFDLPYPDFGLTEIIGKMF